MIGLSILLKNGAKLRTKFTWQKDAQLDKSMTWEIAAKLGKKKGAKSDSIPFLPPIPMSFHFDLEPGIIWRLDNESIINLL